MTAENITRVRIELDEWYPVYTITDRPHAKEVDLPNELIERLQKTQEAWEKIQDEVHDLYRKQYHQ